MTLSQQDIAELQAHRWRASSGRTITLDFPVSPKVRFGWGKPTHGPVHRKIDAGADRYRNILQDFQRLRPMLAKIPLKETQPGEPHWVNDWLPAADAISIYGTLALKNPKTYFEIGSGISTTFARQAIRDHGLRTKIISIDPEPRRSIDAICDEVIRSGLEDCDLSVFDVLQSGDVVFCDNSHRSFQNSDVTVFFMDVMPILPVDAMIGIHDIFLPHDYPAGWLSRFYNEQYLLACCLLAGDVLKIQLPVYHCLVEPSLRSAYDPLLSEVIATGANQGGGAFWFTLDRPFGS